MGRPDGERGSLCRLGVEPVTIWEALFGTPERAAKTLSDDGMALDQIDSCWLAEAIDGENFGPEGRCRNCLYEYDRYGCERSDVTLLEWLSREVAE